MISYFHLFDLLANTLQGIDSKGGHSKPRLKYEDHPQLEKIAAVVFAADSKDSFAGRTLAAALWERGESQEALKVGNSEQVLASLGESDPTRKHYYQWLCELMKKARPL